MKLKSLRHELSSIVHNKKVLIPVIAVMLVPLLYCGMFLWAFWNPYEKMDMLPVAVVNSDLGAELQGKTMNVGKDLAKNLKDSKNFDWQFVSKEQAESGLADQTYYMAIEIPADFSQKVTTVMDEKPQQAEVLYIPNESYNFLASQIGTSAIEKIKGELSRNVTEAYSKTIFESVGTLVDGISQAGDGATKLADGSKELDSGVQTVKTNLTKLASGAIDLKNGVQLVDANTGKLVSGAEELKTGVQTLDSSVGQLATGAVNLQKGAEAVDTGLGKLVQGAAPLKAGVATLKAGAVSLTGGLTGLNKGAGDLAGGLAQLQQGGSQLATGAAQAAGGATQLEQGLNTSKEGLTKLSAGSQGVSGGLEAYVQTHPELANDAAFTKLLAASKSVTQGLTSATDGQDKLIAGAKQLEAGSVQMKDSLNQFSGKLAEAQAGGEQLAAGSSQLQTGAGQLEGGLDRLAGGADQLVTGATQLQVGTHQLAAGASTLAGGTGQLTAGTHKLAAGADQLANGTAQLRDGASKLAGGAVQVAGGATQLDEGASQLVTGADQLAAGNAELASKLTDASKQTGSLSVSEANEKMFAGPVGVTENKFTEVPNYGTGFAPYFISLGLFVGALLLTIVFPMKQPVIAPKSGLNWFLSKFLIIVGVGIFQAVFLDTILLTVLHLKVQNIPLFILMTIFTSVTFMTIIQFLVTAFADVGRFMAIVLLIFQLTTCAGTFPVELLPNFLQFFHKLLPMTYSVFGFKDVISGGNYTSMWENAGFLFIYIGVFAMLTLGYLTLSLGKNTESEEHEVSLAL
ncbi:MAG: YhgE/Pip domain-containing protein [Gorillibacterium sp.]|nr:YhgE/Pip domain-containing protein [Gorillibacterium sp.]